MPLTVWQDAYDGIWVCHEGLAGGYDWLMVGLTSQHVQVQQVLEGLPGAFKGRLQVLLLPEVTALPLERALQEHPVRGVMVLGRDLQGGPALDLPERHVDTTSGLVYQEGGSYPAWNSVLSGQGDALPDLWASACTKLGVPVVVCSPERALETWQLWWEKTPLALQNLET
ncbi:hypothetical protein [Deinococcus roseus]|uniref:Uncharacterized protein n=1 Tax=Deinococcus roseus TaxID=392414 RepID=A0ABQ2DB95_9DEIO|nr:hypothetical protein [Deinococcus roseus]GGJ49844.1 hypothetical protein GCM10008938_39770 [Deinococcus roseus]